MHLEMLFGFLLVAAICALLALLAGVILKVRLTILGYVGAGLLGAGIGSWLASVLDSIDLPGRITIDTASVHLIWAFLGALIVVAIVKFLPVLKR